MGKQIPLVIITNAVYNSTAVDYKLHDDETLLRLVNRAQEQALSELYDRFSRLVYSIAMNTVGNPSLAEEITQDVFLRVWDKAETYRVDQGKVVTWIASIARNRSIDVLRRQRVRPEGNQTAWDEESFSTLAASTDVESEVESSLARRRVLGAIAQLPEEQRAALSLAYFQGYTHRQIAELLSEPLGTVKTRIRLAMQKLRQILQES